MDKTQKFLIKLDSEKIRQTDAEKYLGSAQYQKLIKQEVVERYAGKNPKYGKPGQPEKVTFVKKGKEKYHAYNVTERDSLKDRIDKAINTLENNGYTVTKKET